MRGPNCSVAIDLRTERDVLALAASQHSVDETRSTCVAHLPCRLDCLGHGCVRGDLCVKELTQPDDREPAHVRIELLSGAREQALEQGIESQVPADAVVDKGADQAAFLARRLLVDNECRVE
jgi:hypothetical protein